MDLTIIAVYTICDDFLILRGHQDHPVANFFMPLKKTLNFFDFISIVKKGQFIEESYV